MEERQKISIAASAQKIFEFYLQRIISEYKLDEISDKLVYAGGCALNSLANGKILLKNKFKEKNENINKRLDDQEKMINKLMILLNGKKDRSTSGSKKPTAEPAEERSNKKKIEEKIKKSINNVSDYQMPIQKKHQIVGSEKQIFQRGHSGKEKDGTLNKSPLDYENDNINKNNESRLNMLSSIATEMSESASFGDNLREAATFGGDCRSAASFGGDRQSGAESDGQLYGRQSGGIILMMSNPLNNRNKNVNFNLQEINDDEDDSQGSAVGDLEECEDQEINDEDEEEINKELESELADLLG